MYITASLPAMYGRFNQIRKDNYPFRTIFTKYLEAISTLGLNLQMDADMLVGVIEDALLGDARLPDIPEGTEAVKFRFTIKNETIETYFDGSELTNKTIIMLVVRMTLRLSEQFGTSLSRLTRLISEIPVAADVDNSVESVNKLPEPEPVREPVRISRTVRPQIPKPVTIPEHEEKPAAKETSSLLDRLEELTKKGDELIADEPELTTVETNPLLSDFL